MTFAKAFAGVLVAFFAIDILWIIRVVRPMYDQQLGGLLRASPLLGRQQSSTCCTQLESSTSRFCPRWNQAAFVWPC
jgi:hypothetical protein